MECAIWENSNTFTSKSCITKSAMTGDNGEVKGVLFINLVIKNKKYWIKNKNCFQKFISRNIKISRYNSI